MINKVSGDGGLSPLPPQRDLQTHLHSEVGKFVTALQHPDPSNPDYLKNVSETIKSLYALSLEATK